MANKLVLTWCLLYLYLEADAGRVSRNSEELSDARQCNFDVSRIYDVTDLLGCVNKLMIDLSAQENARSLRQTSGSSPSAYRENPYDSSLGDLVSSLFNNGIPPINDYFPLDPVAGQHQLNRPITPADLSGQFSGLGANLYDALSSISRYDDSKCVPRIVCEVASGRPPGEYKQASSNLDDLGRNVLVQWLIGLDAVGKSPVLNFARAAALGYSNRGDPSSCYRAFPRCPRNPDKLVHYLNNHNGGFFRLFDGRDGYRAQQSYASQGNSKFLRGGERKALPPGYAGAAADRTGTGKLKFDVPVLSAQRDYRESFSQGENISRRRLVFPAHEKRNDRLLENRTPKSSPGYEGENASSRDNPPFFFPQEDQDASRFAPYSSDSESRSEFRFPH